jgi:hypothetical protein
LAWQNFGNHASQIQLAIDLEILSLAWNVNFDTKCAIAAVIMAVITATVVVYQVRVRRAAIDREAIRWAGILLALTFSILITTFYHLPCLPVVGNYGWAYGATIVGFGAFSAWLVLPRK